MIGEIKKTRKVGDNGEWIVTDHYFLDGEEVTERRYRKFIPEKDGVPMFAASINDANPWTSDSLACHSSQIAEIKKRNAKHGLHINYTATGKPICTDSGQRKKLMAIESKAIGGKVHDRNSFYGA